MTPVPESSDQPISSPSTSTPADRRGRWVAILTGALSILIGVVYLILITVLDQRGPLLPPPPEALAGVAVGAPFAAAGARSPG